MNKFFRVITNIDRIYELEADNRDDAYDLVLGEDGEKYFVEENLQGADVYDITDEEIE